MIIGIDGTPLAIPTGGIRRYTEELALALAAGFEGDEVYLLSDQPFSLSANRPTNLHLEQGPVAGFRRRWWSLGLPATLRRYHADIFHGTDFAVPYLGLRPAVMTLHDLSPWREAAWHTDAELVRWRTPALLRLGAASMVITPTEAIRREAIEYFGLHPARVEAVPEAASSVFQPAQANIAAEPYILYAGTLEPRKNIGTVIESWRIVRRQFPIRLVLAGRRRADLPDLLPDVEIEQTGPVTDEQLACLYANAAVVVYPSSYEGFGLPVLEAMQCGAAVIASRDPAIVEVAGGAAIHVDALDVRGWAAAISSVVCEGSRASSLREQGIRRAAEFSWRRTARLTHEVYEEAIRRFHG